MWTFLIQGEKMKGLFITGLIALASMSPLTGITSEDIPNCEVDNSTPICFRDHEVSTPRSPNYFNRNWIFVYDKFGYVKCLSGSPLKRRITNPRQLIRVPMGTLRRDSSGNLTGGRSKKGPARTMKIVRADEYFDSLDSWEESISQKGLSLNGLSKNQIKTAKIRARGLGRSADATNAICYLGWRDLIRESYLITDSEIRSDIESEMIQRDLLIRDSYFPKETIEFDESIEMQNKSLSFLKDSSSLQEINIEDEIIDLEEEDLNLTQRLAAGEIFVDREEIERRNLDSIRQYEDIQGPLGDQSPYIGRNSFDKGDSWDVIFGNENIFAAEAYIESNQYSDKGFDLETSNEMGANIYVFGTPLNIATATSSAYTNFSEKMVEHQLTIAGRDIDQFNEIKSGNTAKMATSNASETVQKQVSLSFSLGPIPVAATTGARGTVSMSAFSHAMKVQTMSSLVPSISVVGFAELAIDVFVARAGVGGALRIIKDDVSVVSELTIKNRPRTGAIAFYSEMSAINTLRTLDGRLYAFAELSNPFGRNPRYEHNIFRWGGATHSGALYSDSEYVDLFY